MREHADALILGCGYLGTFLLSQVRGRVVAVTRSERRHPGLQRRGAVCVSLDLALEGAGDSLVRSVGRCEGEAFLLVPPSGLPEQGAAHWIAALWDGLRRLGVRRAVLASSTGVYGDRGGRYVTAESPLRPATTRERRLCELERAWLGEGDGARVLRLGGLYGPGRVIGLRALRQGLALPGAADDWLNLVRAEDAAAALVASASLESTVRVGLVTDGTPVTRAAYYGQLAKIAGIAPPVFGAGERRGGSRRCDPTATWQALGLVPAFPDSLRGLSDIVPASGPASVTPG